MSLRWSVGVWTIPFMGTLRRWRLTDDARRNGFLRRVEVRSQCAEEGTELHWVPWRVVLRWGHVFGALLSEERQNEDNMYEQRDTLKL
jgi:hypothetical protein